MMNIEAPPVKAVPEAVRNRPAPQSSRFKAVPEWARSEAPHPPRRDTTAVGCNMAWPTKRSASGGGRDGSGRREPFMECA